MESNILPHSIALDPSVSRAVEKQVDGSFTLVPQYTPNYAALIDTVEDQIRECIEENMPIRDLALELVGETKREALREILLKLLVILGDSRTPRLDIEVLISASGLALRNESDTAIAKRLNVSKQVFSSRKKVLLARLDLKAPAHSKSQSAKEEYALCNPKRSSV